MATSLQKGDRVRLIAMPNDPNPILAGTTGTVVDVHDHRDWTQVEVDWDDGRTLMLTLPDDSVEIVMGTNQNSSN